MPVKSFINNSLHIANTPIPLAEANGHGHCSPFMYDGQSMIAAWVHAHSVLSEARLEILVAGECRKTST